MFLSLMQKALEHAGQINNGISRLHLYDPSLNKVH